MTSTTPIQAVDMMRRIRDAQASDLATKSEEDVLAFFHEAGERALADARHWQATAAAAKTGS